MKSEVYIFGNFASGYSQYPDDYMSEVLQGIGKTRSSESELIYQRRGSLTYYTYVRTIDKQQNNYIGLCCVFNGVLIKDISSLFSVFEEVINFIVLKGEVLEFTDEGRITTKINYLHQHKEELIRISDYLNIQLVQLAKSSTKLPPENYSISSEEWKKYLYTETESINSAVLSYPNIKVIKGENYDNEGMTSYSMKLYNLNQEKKKALEIVENQKQTISELNKKQKNYKLVIWLIVIIFIGLIVGINFISDKNRLISELKDYVESLEHDITIKKETIEIQDSTILKKEQDIRDKNYEIYVLNEDLYKYKDSLFYSRDTVAQLKLKEQEARREIDELRSSFKSGDVPEGIPLYIKRIDMANVYRGGEFETSYGKNIYSSNTMYLKPRISYIGIDTYKEVELMVKLYGPGGLSTGSSSPKGGSYSNSFKVYSGENSYELSGWGGSKKGNYQKGQYRIEIWYKNICLKSKTFTIY